MTSEGQAPGGGLNERAFEPATGEGLSGTGGGAGGGTRSGEGDPSGLDTDHKRQLREATDLAPGGGTLAAAGELAGAANSEIAAEAAALGNADGSLADAAGTGGGGRTIGDAVGGSAGRDIGSGTPGDRGELGGGDPMRD